MSISIAVMVLASLGLAAVSGSAAGNVITNPGFEKGLADWDTHGKAEFALDQKVKHAGKQSVRITVAPDAALEYQQVGWKIPAKPGEELHLSFWVKCKNATDGAGVYGGIEYYRGDERLGYVQTFPTRSEKWHHIEMYGQVPADATHARLALVIHSHGTVWFDDVSFGPPLPQPEKATLTLRKDKPITDNWRGFGCQGDLLFRGKANVEQGVNEADRKLVYDRVRQMRPQIVRMLFQVNYWEPELGKRTPDSDEMKDLRETIALYKSIGADVHLTEWGFPPPAWARPAGIVPHPDEVSAFVGSFVAAIRYLREDCGFDNIRYVAIYNEPNGSQFPLKDYAAIYRELDRSLKSAGLREQVAILGPDEANNYDWLPWSIRELNDVIDYYDAHNYTADDGEHFGSWVAARTADMPKWKRQGIRPQRKRLMVTEFGMHDRMETFSTPHNDEYDYGIFLADSAINAARAGASAMLMWCLMDTNYWQYRMKWGLWKFKDEKWEPRPGFYAWSLLTRNTERGSTVYRVDSNVEDAVAVAFRAPGTVSGFPLRSNPETTSVLVVNRRKADRPFTLKGLPPYSKWEPYIYSEKSVPTPDLQMIRPGAILKSDGQGRLRGALPRNSFVLFRERLD